MKRKNNDNPKCALCHNTTRNHKTGNTLACQLHTRQAGAMNQKFYNAIKRAVKEYHRHDEQHNHGLAKKQWDKLQHYIMKRDLLHKGFWRQP